MAKPRITQAELKRLLHYDLKTGVFMWRSRRAGHLSKEGYRVIGIGPHYYKAAHLAYFYVTGFWPDKEMMDHWDGDRDNNAFANLRPATRSENLQNLHKARSDNQCGFLGVSPKGRKWQAKINILGKRHYLGCFDTPELAYEAYLAAKRRLHPGARLSMVGNETRSHQSIQQQTELEV